MTSSTLAGERRWASTRRSGMTVLGKVAVPKPLNLPSQRLENHGLDPNVEIVPKGTLSWGNRSSSSTSSAWGSSTLSPNADGSTYSPTNLNGHPSSGGSGTRPSTASSDKVHEPTTIAWGPNSRPSSASGSLTSSQASLTSLRPRSAETRPCSSQLSRFAEASTDSSVAWGASGTTQKGAASSDREEFSLSSGYFPTLGSDKDNVQKNSEPQDHGSHFRPGSSSGRVVPVKECSVTSQDDKGGYVDSWKRDAPQNVEDGVQRRMENWDGDSQQYLNTSGPSQPFDVWRGHPVNAHPGVWFRGPPGCPPYGAHVPPGGFPIESFPYFRPQIPPNLAHSQPIPSSGAGPRGHHLKNDDLYRPQMPDAYIRPGMQIRPGFFPGPMPCEGYYGPPPMGYCNNGERDLPFMGMPPGPSVYNQFRNHGASNPSNIHGGVGGHGSMAKASSSEQGKSDDRQGQCEVFQKKQSDWDRKEEENLKNAGPRNALSIGEGDKTGSVGKNELITGCRGDYMYQVGESYSTDKEKYDGFSRIPADFSRTNENQGGFILNSVQMKAHDSVATTKIHDDSRGSPGSCFPEGPEFVSSPSSDSTLIQKIEGLNAKARASDGHIDITFNGSYRDNNSKNEAAAIIHSNALYGGNHILGSCESVVCVEDKASQPTSSSGMTNARRGIHGVESRLDHRGKGRYNAGNAADTWRRSVAAEASAAVPAISSGPYCNLHGQDDNPSLDVVTKSLIDLPVKVEGELVALNLVPSDSPAQRAKIRELAKQRALQLQKEEEERTREQKAKAFAKLEELNRRSEFGDNSRQKLEEARPSHGIQHRQDDSVTPLEPVVFPGKFEEPNLVLVSDNDMVAPVSEIPCLQSVESAATLKEPSRCMPEISQLEVADLHSNSLQSEPESHNADPKAAGKVAPQVIEKHILKYKRIGNKQEYDLSGKSAPVSIADASRKNGDAPISVTATKVASSEIALDMVPGLPSDANIMEDSLAHQHQKRKNNRNWKNKPGTEDAKLSNLVFPTLLKDTQTHSSEHSVEKLKPEGSHLEGDSTSIQSPFDAKDGAELLEQHPVLATEEAHGRETNQWKFQRSHRTPRNSQANRFVDKFHNSDTVMWAPVRSQNKAKAMNEAIDKTVTEDVTADSRSDIVMQSSSRNKRAEMKRYIPKPVAKELAQQGCILQPAASSLNDAMSDETAGRGDSGIQGAQISQPHDSTRGNAGPTADTRNVHNKQSKSTKVHGAWRQRGSTDSRHSKVSQEDALLASGLKNSVKKFVDQHQFLKTESVKDGLKCSDSVDISSGGNIPKSVDAASHVSLVVKDQGIMDKGKQHDFKGRRGTGNNQDDCKIFNTGDTIRIQFGDLDISEAEGVVASREHCNTTGDGTSSRWQPKSQTNNQRSKSAVSQDITSDIGKDKKDAPSPKLHIPLGGEGTKSTAQPRSYQTTSERSNIEGAPTGHQEPTREKRITSSKRSSYSPGQQTMNVEDLAPPERKVTSSKRHPYSSNHGPAAMDETTSLENMNNQHGQHVSSEFHKNGNRNNRSGRGHESRGDWNSSRQDNRQHGPHVNRDRQRQSSHYEYQPVGPYNSSKSNNFEGQEGSHSQNTTSKYRESGQVQSRRGGGNFHGRQTGSVQT